MYMYWSNIINNTDLTTVNVHVHACFSYIFTFYNSILDFIEILKLIKQETNDVLTSTEQLSVGSL